jgi:hypothetical protein
MFAFGNRLVRHKRLKQFVIEATDHAFALALGNNILQEYNVIVGECTPLTVIEGQLHNWPKPYN